MSQATWNDPTATWGDLNVAWDGTRAATPSAPASSGGGTARKPRLYHGVVYRRTGMATLVLQASGVATVDRYADRHQRHIEFLVTIGEL